LAEPDAWRIEPEPVLQIGADYILTKRRDPLEVEFVRAFRLDRRSH
jgi:hypothetical protein